MQTQDSATFDCRQTKDSGGISSKKLPDPNEGGIDNKNLYNDKELFEEADLDWYDYGFRNYDPQIGRFTQLDPLTDSYPQLTSYQYASNDPIANIDIDGLEGFNSLQTLETVVIKGIRKAAPAAVKTVTLSALNIGVNAYKIGKAVSDKTLLNNNTKRNINVPLSKEKRGGIRATSASGEGEDGAVHSDYADGQSISIDLLMYMFSTTSKGKPHPLKPDFNDPLTYPRFLGKLLKLNQQTSTPKKFETENESNNPSPKANQNPTLPDIDPVFREKDKVIYNRNGGFKRRNDGKGGGIIVGDEVKANDTFPAKKVPPDYIYPLK